MDDFPQSQKRILEGLDFYRGLIIDAVEQEASNLASWPYLRSRLLKCLGEKGLEGFLKTIIADSQGGQK